MVCMEYHLSSKAQILIMSHKMNLIRIKNPPRYAETFAYIEMKNVCPKDIILHVLSLSPITTCIKNLYNPKKCLPGSDLLLLQA